MEQDPSEIELEPRLRQGFGGQANKNWFYNHKFLSSTAIVLLVVLIIVCADLYHLQKQASQSVNLNTQPDIVFCGGIGGIACPTTGYKCVSEGNFPDAGTNCTKIEGTGILSGHVTIGPFCPVEREGVPCPVPPEAYSATQIVVYKSGTQEVVAKKSLDSSGNYSFILTAGNYSVDYLREGQMYNPPPVAVTIESSQTTTQDFDIDTGIR